MKTFREFTSEEVNEGTDKTALETVKASQVEYANIAEKVSKSKEYKAFVEYVQDLVTETFDYELDKTANDWAIIGVMAKLKWLD
jgi:hypothetical protein